MKNPNFDYDVIYIGSGHAAFDGAKTLCKQGFKIAFVEAIAVGVLALTGVVTPRSHLMDQLL